MDTRPEAEMVLEKLKGGKSFADVAREYSTDPTNSDGGLVGLIPRGNLREEFQTALKRVGSGGTTGIIGFQTKGDESKSASVRRALSPTHYAGGGELGRRPCRA